MLRPHLTLLLVSSILRASSYSQLLADALESPKLNLNIPTIVVSPGEAVQFHCTPPSSTSNAVHFHLYENGKLLHNHTAQIFDVKVNTSSQYSCDYCNTSHTSDRSNSINITVVNLLQPNISFRASGDWFHWWLEGPEVTRGYSFSIICSIQPQYPGGSFHLEFSGSNITRTDSAVNHSTTFSFPQADYVHQGNYSCVYNVTVSSRSFSSNSELLAVTVKASLVPIVSFSAAAAGLLLILVPIVVFLKKRKKQKLQIAEKTYRRHCARAPAGNEETDGEDDDDYENAEMALHQREDSDESGADYVDIDADVEKTGVVNNRKCAGVCVRNEMEDEDDDYENAGTVPPEEEGSDVSDENYINIEADVEETAAEEKNTNRITGLWNNMEDEDDNYESGETVLPEKEDLVDSDDDYINVDADVGEPALEHQFADAEHPHETSHVEMEMDDEDNYENSEGSEFSDEDYINVN
ncbi:uncharacterized protein [Salminus brasiliensis]|uniref:uncharacterized protein n=1 Tax=Salminus brasiliensis TaxID=930266 RepID=UPI003B82F113